MKILITYYSATGNTEKVAYIINEGITGYNVNFFLIKQIDPKLLSSYNITFLGSGIYGFVIHRKVTNLIKRASKLPSRFTYF